MRFLFAFAGGNGHFLPTLPIARAVVKRGHRVAYACQEAMVGTVAATGFPVFATGGPTLLDPGTRRPLVAVDRAAEERAVRCGFAGRTARDRAPKLLQLAARWQADVIVRDEMDFGAVVAAESLRIPHASVIVIAAGGLVRTDVVVEPLAALRVAHGLEPGPELEMLHRYLTLVPVPPSYRSPSDRLPATAHHLRPGVLENDSGHASGDLWGDRPQPSGRFNVYFTLGTIFHQESGDLFTRVLAGLRDLPVDVVVTVGQEVDPAELGVQPANVRVERFVPQAGLLARSEAVISHGGSGSVIGSLAFGVPSVLLPMGADQPLNAERCGDLGVAQVLDVATATPAEIGRAVMAVCEDPSYRSHAAVIRDEIRALPGAEHAALLLEQLGADRVPITQH